ncbi:LOW QUALITY PROTEIN: hypothetical protein U9M48_006945 [Paspalum notatum var. saurae]|uniref:PWI domain-containing protein n=1 Tax=Paspalum notatum var. saurae TaxID=547442 RepID=A0AAQ3PZN8_PASNO
MSGGFFRGTSADQDTRFSNKQAKLLKTQKFAPELDHLVDTSKVQMDVMKPWIATRVTELLGFEDEVLINFIYGLLEEKEADGKKIQIQLTGFMEKNTVKFMKELWSLLLSAQQNASGVPQQFLDAKEAEIQQRKAEDDRIAQEIQKKREKEGRDSELEKHGLMDGDASNSRSHGDPVGSALNNTNVNAEEEKEMDFKRSSRTKNRGSHRSRTTSLSPRGKDLFLPESVLDLLAIPALLIDTIDHHDIQLHPEILRLPEGSLQEKPLQLLGDHLIQGEDHLCYQDIHLHLHGGDLLSVENHHCLCPEGHLLAIIDHQLVHQGGHHLLDVEGLLFDIDSHQVDADPHLQQGAKIPVSRQTQAKVPFSKKAQATVPISRKAQAKVPISRKEEATVPFSTKAQATVTITRKARTMVSVSSKTSVPISKTPEEIPKFTKNSVCKSTSISPYSSKSPNRSRRSLSRDVEKGTNGAYSVKDRVVLERDQERGSDGDNARDGTRMGGHCSPDPERRLSKSLRSPNYEERNSTLDSSFKSSGKHLPSRGSTDTSGDEEGSRARETRKANSARRKTKDLSAELQLKKVGAVDSSPGEKSPVISRQSGKGIQNKHPDQLSESSEDEFAGRKMKQQNDSPGRGEQRSPARIEKVNEDSQSEDGSPVKKTKKRTAGNSHIDSGSSENDELDKHRSHSDKRRHKKAHKHKKQYDDSSESDSEPDGKEAKRRRKEEKRLRKEERRRKREERHRRRAERHAGKQKLKNTDTVTAPSDSERDRDSDSDIDVKKRGSRAGREESDQKKLEIELREKALESLRAKKAINN